MKYFIVSHSAIGCSDVFTNKKKAIKKAISLSNFTCSDSFITKEDGEQVAWIHHHYYDLFNKYHRTRVSFYDTYSGEWS